MSVKTVLCQPWKKERHRMALFPVRVAEGYGEQCVPQRSMPVLESQGAWCSSSLSNSTEPPWPKWD